MRFCAFAAIGCCLVATGGLAQSNDAAPIAEASTAAPTVKASEDPPWLRRADGLDVAEVFPGAAMRARQYAGDVLVECKVARDGGLVQCAVLEERPEGYGFGKAGLKLAGRFKMKPRTSDGYPTPGGTVRLPLQLRAPR